MNLSAKPLKDAPRQSEIKTAYLQSFPKHEQLPWWILRALTIRKGIDIIAYYDENTFCGFTYTVTEGNILFVLFFAVDYKLRGKGFGSAILKYLKESDPQKTVLLNVEPLDPNASNFDERVRRFRFYEKNGFFDTSYDIEEIGGVFRVLGTSPTFDMEAYQRIFGKMSFGLWKPKIIKNTDTAHNETHHS